MSERASSSSQLQPGRNDPVSATENASSSASSSLPTNNPNNNSTDPLTSDGDVVAQYRELKTKCEALEEALIEHALKDTSDDLQRSNEETAKISEEKNALLQRIEELEKRPQIQALVHSTLSAKPPRVDDGKSIPDATNDSRKRAGTLEQDSRQSKKPRLSTEEAASDANSEPITKTPSVPQNTTGTSIAPVIDPSLTDVSNGASNGNEASASNTTTPSPATPTPPAPSSSMSSNPYAAYLTSSNPYAYYYLQGPPLLPGMHPGLPIAGMPNPRMYMPPPGYPLPTTQNQTPAPSSKTQSPQSDNQARQGQGRPKRLKSHSVTTKNFNIPLVPRDVQGKPMLPLNVGIMTVISLGEVCMREHFHTERYIFPVGYEVTRRYLSTKDKNIEVVYHCSILDGGDGPKFQIIPSDAQELTVIAGTATGAWSNIVRKANAIRNRQHSNSVSGPDFFGLGQNTIKHLIQQLPNANKLRDYVWQNFAEGGPLGGRHAAVVPALPEDYDAAMAMGAYPSDKERNSRRTNQSPDQAGSSKHYPPHLVSPPAPSGPDNSPSGSSTSQPLATQESIPIDPQLTGAEPPSAPITAAQEGATSVFDDGPPGVAEAIATIISALPTSSSSPVADE
ncbi:hypothetical protein V5O48_002130 [Marasmius crinis-equi]|uniref:Transforming growth factor beta regulator 1 n=1 Tax=Marasmius crinis-equi TaxID=585013 RepID=A0ABR3FWI2_9AGAR